MPAVVLYHAGCFDGFCAAWLCRRFLRARKPDGTVDEGSVTYLPVQYGDPLPPLGVTLGQTVLVVDFSYPREQLLVLAESAASVLVLDHHETAEAALAGLSGPNLTVKFRKDRSGAGMVWDHFSQGRPTPWLVRYTEDRDLWRHNLMDTRQVNAALRSYPLDFATWDKLEKLPDSSSRWNEFIREGEAILRVEAQQVEAAVQHAAPVVLCGRTVLTVNTTVLHSEIGQRLAEGKPFGCTWFHGAKGVVVSLRSTKQGVNVAEVAQQYGGGGHRHAAGFTLTSTDAAHLFQDQLFRYQPKDAQERTAVDEDE